MKRFPFLDWMRGLAVVIMIQCHTFNSWTRPDLFNGGPYILTQFVGGMAAPLFLFMAGITLAFQMESLERRESTKMGRWLGALRRGAYVLGIAFAFRMGNFIASLPHVDPHEIIKVDILNCMGVGMAALAFIAVFDTKGRARVAAVTGLAIAAAAPLVANLPWDGAPILLREYVAAGPGRGRFAFFPYASYVAFGLTVGTLVKCTAAERMGRLMRWSMVVGMALVLGGRYVSNLPFSIYSKSDFWTDNPALIVIRVGISLAMLAGAYLWTSHLVSDRWSWMQTLGRHSLMVYWVHVMLVYGDIIRGLKRSLSIGQNVMATVGLVILMLGLSVGSEWWKARRAARWRAGTTAKGAVEVVRG